MTPKKSRPVDSFVEPSILAALGSLVVNFNTTEGLLALTISDLLGCGHLVGSCVTAQLSFRGLINAFCSLYYLRTANDPDTVASVQSLRIRLEAAEQKRNELLHSEWPGFSEHYKISARAKRGLVLRRAVLSPADITAIADEMAGLSGEILDLLLAFWDKYES